MESLESKIQTFLSIGYGSGYGDGDGDGSGYGSGYGDGDGDGSGSGYGDGSGSGYGLKSFNGIKLYDIDGVETAITSVRNNFAKGFVVNNDLTTSPCFVVKQNNIFAHGNTLEEAMKSLQDKLFEDMSDDERIEAFVERFNLTSKHPAKDYFEWHHKLTGSCQFGREQFARDHQINLESDEFTVKEFIELTKNSYGGEIIRRLESVIKAR